MIMSWSKKMDYLKLSIILTYNLSLTREAKCVILTRDNLNKAVPLIAIEK
jgi:hypothetical protein